MARLDPQIAAHLEWIGFVRPTGLVVSAPALVKAGALLNRRDAEGQQLLRGCVEEPRHGRDAAGTAAEPEPRLPDFRAFASSVLGWNFSPAGYAGTEEAPIPPDLEAVLPEGGEVLRPDFTVRADPVRGASAARPESAVRESAAVYSPAASHETATVHGAERERTAANGASPWQLLVRVCEPDEDFDHVTRGRSRANGGLEASPHGRMERLLRHTGVAAGLLFNGTALRLISAPRGESSGWLDFRVADMLPTAGRPISTAMRLLLGQTRLLSVPRPKRLAALLEDSRKYQNEVSERLAEQVLHALYELLRGLQAAHDPSKGELLREPLAENPDEVYRGLLTVVLRLVFLLYAEERDMLPQDETFLGAYSLAGLYERLREDAALHPDTMDQRFGGYAQLLALFRMVHDGARAGAMRLPPRHGALFDPDRYRFLEGRGAGGARQIDERIDPPLVPDGTIYRVLEKLIVLDGERISYRALDVEHVGSVYETMMGFRLETAEGLTVAIKAAKKQGAPAAVNLNRLLDQPPASRAKWLQDRTDRKLTDRLRRAAGDAGTMEALHAALDPVIDRNATPDLVPQGAMVLQPSEERRRSGSHYTPRELTEPIVRTALAPIFDRLRAEGGGALHPEQILDLKVCDPAMGSGAFLVEACRQLGDALVAAWQAHDAMPEIAPDERTRSSSPAARSHSAASTVWTATPRRSTSPSCRSGSSPWRRTIPSPSWTMRCVPAMRWSGSRGGSSTRFTGRTMRSRSRPDSKRCGRASIWPRQAGCAGASGRRTTRCPRWNSAVSVTMRDSRRTTCAFSATWPSPRSSRGRSRSSARTFAGSSGMRFSVVRCMATWAGWRSCGARSRRSRRFTGRSSFRRCSTGRIRDLMQSWGIRRSRGRTRSRRPTSPAIRTGSSRCTRRATATPTWSPTSFAVHSGYYVPAAHPV